MTTIFQCRLGPWQFKELERLAKKSDLSMSHVARFALDYLFLNYEDGIDEEVLDEMGFKARKKLSS